MDKIAELIYNAFENGKNKPKCLLDFYFDAEHELIKSLNKGQREIYEKFEIATLEALKLQQKQLIIFMLYLVKPILLEYL